MPRSTASFKRSPHYDRDLPCIVRPSRNSARPSRIVTRSNKNYTRTSQNLARAEGPSNILRGSSELFNRSNEMFTRSSRIYTRSHLTIHSKSRPQYGILLVPDWECYRTTYYKTVCTNENSREVLRIAVRANRRAELCLIAVREMSRPQSQKQSKR